MPSRYDLFGAVVAVIVVLSCWLAWEDASADFHRQTPLVAFMPQYVVHELNDRGGIVKSWPHVTAFTVGGQNGTLRFVAPHGSVYLAAGRWRMEQE